MSAGFINDVLFGKEKWCRYSLSFFSIKHPLLWWWIRDSCRVFFISMCQSIVSPSLTWGRFSSDIPFLWEPHLPFDIIPPIRSLSVTQAACVASLEYCVSREVMPLPGSSHFLAEQESSDGKESYRFSCEQFLPWCLALPSILIYFFVVLSQETTRQWQPTKLHLDWVSRFVVMQRRSNLFGQILLESHEEIYPTMKKTRDKQQDLIFGDWKGWAISFASCLSLSSWWSLLGPS